MNRRERRAAKVKAKHRGIDPITAFHEAGHAVGRFLTAPDMGFPEDEVITEIVMCATDNRPESLAVCEGPTFSAES